MKSIYQILREWYGDYLPSYNGKTKHKREKSKHQGSKKGYSQKYKKVIRK